MFLRTSLDTLDLKLNVKRNLSNIDIGRNHIIYGIVHDFKEKVTFEYRELCSTLFGGRIYYLYLCKLRPLR